MKPSENIFSSCVCLHFSTWIFHSSTPLFLAQCASTLTLQLSNHLDLTWMTAHQPTNQLEAASPNIVLHLQDCLSDLLGF